MSGETESIRLRRRVVVDRPPRPEGELVVYWMTSARRLGWNYGLDRALAIAREHRRPLVVLEALRVDYRWASERCHAFVLDGMAENARRAAESPVLYYPYVERAAGEGRGLLAELSRRAVAIVTDDFPCFFLPGLLAAAARRVECRLEAVDSNGLLPLAVGDRAFPTAYAFRRFLHGQLKPHLFERPAAAPLARAELPPLGRLPAAIEQRWPPASPALLARAAGELSALPIDHGVPPVPGIEGGSAAATRRLEAFLERTLSRYAEERNEPALEASSGLSPWLHFGHLAVHEILARLAEREGWDPADLPERGDGARAGWWRMSAPAEAFLDQTVTWRELGFHFCARRPDDYDRFESLPDWARETLARHAADRREPCYELATLERAETHDPLWNAAQRQLVTAGRIHNYLRMLWGKKVLEWSATPELAAEHLIELNNRYALDGRDPNSCSGIFWCLGRFDRPWGPERAIFGTVRYMSSLNTARKLRLEPYLRRYGPNAAPPLEP